MISLALDQLIASSAFGGAGEFTRGRGRSGAGNPYRSGVLESIFEALDSSGASCLRWRCDLGLVRVVGSVVLGWGSLASDVGSIIREEKREDFADARKLN